MRVVNGMRRRLHSTRMACSAWAASSRGSATGEVDGPAAAEGGGAVVASLGGCEAVAGVAEEDFFRAVTGVFGVFAEEGEDFLDAPVAPVLGRAVAREVAAPVFVFEAGFRVDPGFAGG